MRAFKPAESYFGRFSRLFDRLEEFDGLRPLIQFVRNGKVVAFAATDHPRRQVNCAAKKIEFVVRIDGQTRADVQTALELQTRG